MVLLLAPEDGRTLRVLGAEESAKEFLTYTKTAATHSSWLLVVDEALASFKRSLKDVTGIVVVGGAGSFTGSRVAFTIGNTLAYALSVPISGIEEEELMPSTVLKKIRETTLGRYAIPTYSGMPNIGHKTPH